MSSHHFKQSFAEINKYKDLSELKKAEVNLQNKNGQRPKPFLFPPPFSTVPFFIKTSKNIS